MPGDLKTETETTVAVADLVAQPWGTPKPSAEPIDWEARSAERITEAKRETALARWQTIAVDSPELVETDWARERFDANRGVIEQVKSWRYGQRGLLISGPTGRGKTRALFALMQRLCCEDAIDVRYWYAGDWFAALQSQCRYGRDEARSWVEAVASRALVVLDDLGQEAVDISRKDWAQAWFFRFLDLRISRGLPIIVTTNLSAKEVAGVDGENDRNRIKNELRKDPLLRRMQDMCQIVKFKP